MQSKLKHKKNGSDEEIGCDRGSLARSPSVERWGRGLGAWGRDLGAGANRGVLHVARALPVTDSTVTVTGGCPLPDPHSAGLLGLSSFGLWGSGGGGRLLPASPERKPLASYHPPPPAACPPPAAPLPSPGHRPSACPDPAFFRLGKRFVKLKLYSEGYLKCNPSRASLRPGPPSSGEQTGLRPQGSVLPSRLVTPESLSLTGRSCLWRAGCSPAGLTMAGDGRRQPTQGSWCLGSGAG